LFSSVLLLNLRVLGVNGTDQGLDAAYRRYRPWMWSALFMLIFSGVILLISEPVRNMVNSVFWIKMSLLLVAVVCSLWFQRSLRNHMGSWDISPSGQASLRTGAVFLTILWCLVIAGGRWIAYAPN
jgi:hypothetical protein